jgi:glycosyltransferase involved in cell wall biosynthesis
VDIDFPVDKKVVLYAGTFGNVNGLSYVNKLAKETLNIDPNLWFYLIGKGKEKEDNIKEAEKLGVLNRNVFFFDPVNKNDLPYLYSKCTVGSSFVIDIPALWDNSANKFFDTLAAKKPMLINHEGWQADLIRKKNIGYVLPPYVDFSVAGQFVDYINDVDLLQNQSNNAFQVAKDEFSLEVAVRKYMNIFDSIRI